MIILPSVSIATRAIKLFRFRFDYCRFIQSHLHPQLFIRSILLSDGRILKVTSTCPSVHLIDKDQKSDSNSIIDDLMEDEERRKMAKSVHHPILNQNNQQRVQKDSLIHESWWLDTMQAVEFKKQSKQQNSTGNERDSSISTKKTNPGDHGFASNVDDLINTLDDFLPDLNTSSSLMSSKREKDRKASMANGQPKGGKRKK